MFPVPHQCNNFLSTGTSGRMFRSLRVKLSKWGFIWQQSQYWIHHNSIQRQLMNLRQSSMRDMHEPSIHSRCVSCSHDSGGFFVVTSVCCDPDHAILLCPSNSDTTTICQTSSLILLHSSSGLALACRSEEIVAGKTQAVRGCTEFTHYLKHTWHR